MYRRPCYGMILAVIAAMALIGAVAPGWAQTTVAPQATGASADATGGAEGRPQIRFASREHDFGQAISGTDLKTTFTFQNVGDAVLVIEKVKGG